MHVQTGVSYLQEIASKASEMEQDFGNFADQGGADVFKRAFGELRKILPCNEDFENMSELDILELAMDYIHNLEDILQQEKVHVNRPTEIKG